MPRPPHTVIPLASLLVMLKAEGFDISTSTLLDIQKVIASLGYDELNDFRELKSVLSPFICRNKEEQDRFNKVFDKYARSVTPAATLDNISDGTSQKKSRRIAAIIAFLLLLAAGIFYIAYLRPGISSVDLVIETSSGTSDLDPVIHDTVIFRTHLDKRKLSANQIASIRIDDTVYEGMTEVRKLFRTAGPHLAEAWIQNASGDTIARSSLKTIEVQCEKPPSVVIKKRNTGQGINSNTKTYVPEFTNPSQDSSLYRFKWFINDDLVSTQKVFTTPHSSDNGYKISLHVDADSAHCSTDSLTASFNELPAYDLSIAHSNPLKFDEMNWRRIAWVSLYGLFLPVAAGVFIVLFKRKKKRKAVASEILEETPAEYTGPYQIDFKTQNDKITAENEIGRMAEAMRKRHVGEIMQLNIPKTISKTIRSGGFPSLTFTPRTQPTDFLVFVDKGNSTGHQAQLFEYVLRRLQNEQVNITAYHFYKEPLLLSNEKLNHSMIPVDKVSRLYLNTVLIIFSNTEAFFQSMNRKLKPWVSEKFRAWHRKIIITPVAVDDWDYKETALLSEGFTVVPADLNAHQLIIDEINDLINKDKFRKLPLPHSYSSRFINFDDWKELRAYLGEDPALLQWVCALAVYPYIDWKVTVAIGKAIENSLPGKDRLVTYTNLLKISRIKWMQSGVQPDDLRLKMLHHLDNTTELLARKTILQLLAEVEEDIAPSSLVRSEFDLNKTVNRFLLHTNNPLDNWLTEKERALMKTYVEKQYLDYPLESYLNAADKTLLKENGSQKSISPQEFFEADDELRKRKIKRELMIRRSAAAALIVASILILANFFSDRKNYTSQIQLADISINFSFSGNTIDPSFTELSVTTDGKAYAGQKISDSGFLIRNLPIDSTKPANVTVQNSRGNFFMERPIDLKWKSYNLSIVAPTPKLPLYVRYNDASVFSNIETQLNNDLYRFNISAAQQDFSDSSKIVYYETNQKARADSVADIIKNMLGLNVRTEFIEEIRIPAATPILFLNLATAGPCNAMPLSSMPGSLTEIWRGKTSNRLVTIDLSKRVIYYSTGEKASYGTYHIDDICVSNTGSHKIITSASNQFKVFFLRSIESQSFQLSACADFVPTKEQAINVSENSCNDYDDMSLYYDRRPGIIYIPVDARSYTGQAATTLRNIQQRNASGTEDFRLAINNFFRSSRDEIASRQSQVQQRIPLGKASAYVNWQSGTFKGTPFDRDYIEAKPAKQGDGKDAANNVDTENPPNAEENPSGNIFIKIADINFKENYYPDDAGEALINRISQVLKTDSKSKIKLRGAYTNDTEKRIVDAYIQNTINLIVQRGLSSIRQIEREAYNSAQRQQRNAPLDRTQKLRVEVLGLNFPDSFNNSKKY